MWRVSRSTRVVGLEDVRCELSMLQTPDGHGRKPSVYSRTRSTPSAPRSATTSVAPNSRARSVRPSWRPRITICSAPRRLAAMTPQRPTAPSPTTATFLRFHRALMNCSFSDR